MTGIPTFSRQDDGPLYPKILYNRPITRQGAGRLLVPGGHSGELSLPAAFQQLALAAGVGECLVALPDVLAKLVAGAPQTTFVASSPSGSLGSEALGRLVQLSEDANAVALGASLSSNSHTSILIERLLQEVQQPVVVFADALPALQHHLSLVTARSNALLVVSMPEVFKLAGQLGIGINIRPGGGLLNKLEIVRDVAAASACQYVVYGTETIVAVDGELVVTPANYRLSLSPAAYWAVCATFWLQNPQQQLAALVTAAYILHQAGATVGETGHPATTQLAAAIQQALAPS
jgi:NAD(P)H-hydrate repair Nnr-like enzyme with NAD(P)H-hydrate dehydratase domain